MLGLIQLDQPVNDGALGTAAAGGAGVGAGGAIVDGGAAVTTPPGADVFGGLAPRAEIQWLSSFEFQTEFDSDSEPDFELAIDADDGFS